MIDINVPSEFCCSRGHLKSISVAKLREYISNFPDDYRVFTNMEGAYPGCVLSITEPNRSAEDNMWVIWGTIYVGDETLIDERDEPEDDIK